MSVGFTGRIARASARRPWLTLGVWVAVLGAAAYFAGGLGDVVSQDDRNIVSTEADKGWDLNTQYRGPEEQTGPVTYDETVVVTSDTAQFGQPAYDSALSELTAAIDGVPGVLTVSAPTSAAPFPVSADAHSALVQLTIDDADATPEALMAAVEGLSVDGFGFYNFGERTGELTFDGLAEDTLVKGETIGIAVAIVILVVVFGALMAAGIPLGISLVSILTAVGLTAILGQVFDNLSFFVLNMITMMGLALGIDYTLVAVQRFREELHNGRSVEDAVTITGNTANRAVFFSGVTVLIALVGMLVIPHTIMISLGAGAMLAAFASVLSALTLLPAVLKLLGHRVNKGRVPTAHPGEEPKIWKRIANAVTGRPVVALVAGVAVLGALALPIASMRLAFPGLEALPADNNFRIANEILVDDFDYGQSQTFIAIENPDGAEAQITALADAIAADPGFREVSVDNRGAVVFIDAEDTFDSAAVEAEDALLRLRDQIVPQYLGDTGVTYYVSGEQASSYDFTTLVWDRVPLVLAIVLGSSFVFLLVAFRSIVVPLTSILLNVLSAAAAFGLLVGAFQFGWGEAIGLTQVDGIAPWLPVFLFAVLFGLSMDYHVFLLSRIKEAHDNGIDTRAAIAHGLGRTGSLITGAALIMVAVFSGFAIGDLSEFAQMGFGLAAAVIIDATLVRTILVPAIMSLLGKANWYLPSWLGWLPNMSIEAPEAPSLAAETEQEGELEPALV